MAPRSSSFDAASSLPRHLRARLLRRMLDTLLRTPLHHPRRGRGSYTRRGGCRSGNAVAGRAAHSNNSSTNAHQRGNSVVLQGGPVMVTAFCPRHGRSIYPCGNDGSSSESTPATLPTFPTPAPPPELLLRGTIAARRDAPFFSMMTRSSSSRLPPATLPPLPQPANLTAGRPTATAVATTPTVTTPTAAAAAATNTHPAYHHRSSRPGIVRPRRARRPPPVLPTATASSRPGIARPRRAATARQDAPHPQVRGRPELRGGDGSGRWRVVEGGATGRRRIRSEERRVGKECV